VGIFLLAGTEAGPTGSCFSHSGRREAVVRNPGKRDGLLDTGSRPPQSDSSGMTGSANGDIVSKERGDFYGTKLIGVIENS
jgi:hypothetical protein